jgi:hypothetical protein
MDFKHENISNIPAGINIRLTSNKLHSNEWNMRMHMGFVEFVLVWPILRHLA